MNKRLWISWTGAAAAVLLIAALTSPQSNLGSRTSLDLAVQRSIPQQKTASQLFKSKSADQTREFVRRASLTDSPHTVRPDISQEVLVSTKSQSFSSPVFSANELLGGEQFRTPSEGVSAVSWNANTWPQEPQSFMTDGSCGIADFSYPVSGNQEPPPRMMLGVDQYGYDEREREPIWDDQHLVPWESYAYGEYLGPPRTPHVSDYRLRIGDRVDFVFLLDRGHHVGPYQIYSGDTLSISSIADPTMNQPSLTVLSDGTIALPLIGQVSAAGKTLEALAKELNERVKEFVRKPDIVVQVVRGDTPLNDLRDAVDARAGQGGQSREVTVSPDGVIRLPLIGAVPAIGLSLDEIAEEVNARYAQKLRGISVTPILVQRAPRSIFVLGQVNRPGRIEMQGPTSVMQAIAMAEGWRTGSNLRQIIVFRRDANWQLTATKIDLQGALNGRRPHPADEIWLRDSDIVLVPRSPIQRFSEAVDLYLARSLYAIFPQQGVVFNFDGFQSF